MGWKWNCLIWGISRKTTMQIRALAFWYFIFVRHVFLLETKSRWSISHQIRDLQIFSSGSPDPRPLSSRWSYLGRDQTTFKKIIDKFEMNMGTLILFSISVLSVTCLSTHLNPFESKDMSWSEVDGTFVNLFCKLLREWLNLVMVIFFSTHLV